MSQDTREPEAELGLLDATMIGYFVRTDPLALLLTGGWIVLGAGGYLAVNRGRDTTTAVDAGTDDEPVETDD